ncbi:ABC transporter ATP-binding protein [Neomoorella mulderi]|uniref:Macrolide export ATP-binding/permease protein MacB n=1 Tax=Moorella mulderi DSM 14980 TaxID=1122241 RepID=A0A151AT89_9FIRM|nr:ABC transporter ATP-binding protein [Moorella mulderi]KYH30800.1 macrolide export ATP-binding/permease protein MacB [Moorella mulderi DSM 14980]
MGAPVIQLQGVTRVYAAGENRVQALRGIDLEVAAGEMVAIMGASGSGKSTLMHILGCLDRPTSGRYLLHGQDVSRLAPDQLAYIRNREIGFVFQSFNLIGNMTAWENVALPLIYAGVSRREMQARSLTALRQVGLEGREHHLPTQLSGGQQQRVAIARALVNEPAIILADEPTGALDTRTSVEVMAIFQRLHRERGLTVVIVTHEPDIAAYCRRLVRLRDGLIVADEVVEQPRQAEKELAALPAGEGKE